LYATCSRHSCRFSAEVRIPSRLAPACAGERDGTGRIGNAPRPGNLIISSWRATGLSPWRTVATVDARPFDGRRGQRRTPWRLATRHSRVPPASPGRVPASFAAEAPWAPRRRRRLRAPPAARRWGPGAGRVVSAAHGRFGPARAGPTAFPLARDAISRSQLRIARLGHSGNQRHPGPNGRRTGCARSASATRKLVLTTGTGELGRPRGHQTKGHRLATAAAACPATDS
jgi:hypothetical protein